MAFDRSKPFGEVYGRGAVFYSQMGKYYRDNGDECDEYGKVLEPKADTPPPQFDRERAIHILTKGGIKPDGRWGDDRLREELAKLYTASQQKAMK